MQDLDKILIARVVQNHGGKITSAELKSKIIQMGYNQNDVSNAIDDFKKCRLVQFDGTNFSFK